MTKIKGHDGVKREFVFRHAQIPMPFPEQNIAYLEMKCTHCEKVFTDEKINSIRQWEKSEVTKSHVCIEPEISEKKSKMFSAPAELKAETKKKMPFILWLANKILLFIQKPKTQLAIRIFKWLYSQLREIAIVILIIKYLF